MKLDSAINYGTAVGTQYMQDASYLTTIGMYSVEQAGDIVVDRGLGVNKVLQYHSYREKKASDLVENFQSNCAPYTKELPIFFAKQLDTSKFTVNTNFSES